MKHPDDRNGAAAPPPEPPSSGSRNAAVARPSARMVRRREDRVARRDRELLERLVDRLPVLIAIHHPSGGGVRLNSEFSRVLGWTEEDAARRDLLALCHPDPAERRRAREFIAAGEPGWLDLPTTARGGRRVDCSWAIIRLEDRTVIAIGIDLTERRRASQALRENEQRLRGIFEGAAVGIVEVDPNDRFVSVNDRFCRMLGYDRGEVLGRTFHELTDPRDRRRAAELNGRVHAGQLDLFDYEKRYLRKDGVPVWVHVAVSAVRDADGRHVRSVGTVEDVSFRKSVEAEREKHARHEASLRRLYDSGIIGVFYWTVDGRVVGANDRFLEMIGYDRVDLVAGGIDWRALTPPEFRDEDAARLVEVRSSGAGTAYEKAYLCKDGGRVEVLVGSAMLDDARTEGIAYVVDLTERKAAEARLAAANARLVEADHRKDEFLGMLSHELRNPLAPIRNALYILEKALPGSPQATRARGIASRQVTHLARLVDDLLDVTRVARGKVELRRGPIDLATLVRRTGEDHRPLMAERGLAFDVEAAPGPVTVQGDETRLAQVFGNLLQNAAKFTPPGGHVRLALYAERDEAAVEVTDTGDGLAPGFAEHMFEPFVQAEQTLARTQGGLGLGLALVKGITELHGGRVEARSAGPGQGATFRVTLPLG